MALSWKKRRLKLLQKEPLCRVCAAKNLTMPAQEVDHIIPTSLGGSNDDDNLQPICRKCHEVKTAQENSFKMQIGEDGFPIVDLRSQIINRRDYLVEANRKAYRRRRKNK